MKLKNKYRVSGQMLACLKEKCYTLTIENSKK
jgi:hypothetical protein